VRFGHVVSRIVHADHSLKKSWLGIASRPAH
jgi:hypothetical protein